MNESAIKALSRGDLSDIEQAYYEALESDANSFGLHWVLIGVLSRYGFRTNGTKEAEVLAGDIITCWYQLQK